MKEIPLTQGKVALVDDEDFELLNQYKWYAKRNRNVYYVVRQVHKLGGGQASEYMHLVLLARKLGRPIAKGMECDHKNGDGLDNQRENIQEATYAQNNRNFRRRIANRSSQYIGIHWRRDIQKWQAQATVNRTHIHLGCHATELAAAQAREAFIKAHPELNARPNFDG